LTLSLLEIVLYPAQCKRNLASTSILERKMGAHLAESTHLGADFGFSWVARVSKQILNAIAASAASAADRSQFAALPLRYLDDVGLTEGDRAAALGYNDPLLDPWRVIASQL
jgi:hypothetical protein